MDRLPQAHRARARRAATLNHKGRSIAVPQAALGVARFSFADLCEAPLGPLDYQRIAHTYHTLMVEEIPVLGPSSATSAPPHHLDRRALRQWRRADRLGRGRADALYVDGDGAESFARTASRLMEMRSEAYLRRRRRRSDGATESA